MKNLKEIITQVKMEGAELQPGYNDLLWKLICYPPKLPVRLQQQEFLNEGNPFTLPVMDKFFTGKQLQFNGFIWGNGSRKILLTHGWGSKAVDLFYIISRLREFEDVQIIAFDAPGNGSSEGELSNLILFIEAVKTVISTFGTPDIVLGHSLGAMANAIALDELRLKPALLVSITPLIRLKENFEATLNSAGVPQPAQDAFFESFESTFDMKASTFNLTGRYAFDAQLKHWLAYDENDLISPHAFMQEFLTAHPFIDSHNYLDAGHERILKSPQMIDDLIKVVSEYL